MPARKIAILDDPAQSPIDSRAVYGTRACPGVSLGPRVAALRQFTTRPYPRVAVGSIARGRIRTTTCDG